MWVVLRFQSILTIGLVCCATVLSGVGLVAASGSSQPLRQPTAEDRVIWSVSTTVPDIAITFDDGPDPTYTPRVLTVLRDHRAVATFFVLGRQARVYPGLVKQEAAQGSEVCSHGWSHAKFRRMTMAAVQAEVTRTESLLRQLGVSGCHLFRFPYFMSDATARAAVAALGYGLIGANVDTQDWCRRNAGVMAREVLDRVHPGDIILLHDGGGVRSASVEALRLILDGLPSKGLRPVTVSQLLAVAQRGSTPAPEEE